jgi:hypothetical protein
VERVYLAFMQGYNGYNLDKVTTINYWMIHQYIFFVKRERREKGEILEINMSLLQKPKCFYKIFISELFFISLSLDEF